jgi:hypothetical protein
LHRYDGITGSFLGIVRHEGELNMPIGLAFAPSGKLMVNSRIGAILVELDLKTGKSRPLITGPDNKTLLNALGNTTSPGSRRPSTQMLGRLPLVP